MRKTIMTVLLALLSVALVSGYAHAIIQGKCADCHTMHASQDGTSTTPNDNLTKFSCVACHTTGGVAEAPKIDGQLAAARTAGGTFNTNIVGSAPSKVHNVRDITWTVDESAIGGLLNTTPGAEAGGFTEPAGAAELTCATAKGCHGQSASGFKGFHHNTYPNAYRFLRYNDGGTPTYTDIKGKGSADRELGGATSGNHNVYYAIPSDESTDRNSISSLCSMCHGDFHGQDDTTASGTSPWKRHPTEVLIPSSWNGTDPDDVEVNYDLTPFAFVTADYDTLGTGDPYGMSNNPRVACVSCHRAHGSDYNDLLRFDYAANNMKAGSGGTTGCLACHTAQR